MEVAGDEVGFVPVQILPQNPAEVCVLCDCVGVQ